MQSLHCKHKGFKLKADWYRFKRIKENKSIQSENGQDVGMETNIWRITIGARLKCGKIHVSMC